MASSAGPKVMGGLLVLSRPRERRAFGGGRTVVKGMMAEIGLSATWLSVARLLGYDQFVAFWRLLSSDPALRNDDDQIELRLRPFRAYERYQRNRYIATLVQADIKPSEDRKSVV